MVAWILRLLGFGSDGTTLKFGNTTVHIDLETEDGAVIELTTAEGTFRAVADIDAADIASAVRHIVERAGEAAQDVINKRRAVEDAGRLLGQ